MVHFRIRARFRVRAPGGRRRSRRTGRWRTAEVLADRTRHEPFALSGLAATPRGRRRGGPGVAGLKGLPWMRIGAAGRSTPETAAEAPFARHRRGPRCRGPRPCPAGSYVANRRAPREVLDVEEDLRHRKALVLGVSKLAAAIRATTAPHCLDMTTSCGHLAVAQDGRGPAARDLVHPVRNIDDRDTTRRQVVDQHREPVELGQGSGWTSARPWR